ncbi:SH3 domain-containing protein, partial [Rhizobium sp. NTR19]
NFPQSRVSSQCKSTPIESDNPGRAVVRYTQTAVNLREGPGTKHAVITVIQKGIAVSVIESHGGWSRVQVNGSTTGWMATSTLAEQ